VRLVEDPLDLLIHELGRMLRDLPPLGHVPSEEDLLVGFPDGHQADEIRHPEAGDHAAGHLRRPLDVVARTGGDLLRPEDHLLGDSTPEEHAELPLQPVLRVGVAVLLEGARR
jgi:hypothetical protein